MFLNPQFSLDRILPFLFGLLTCFGFARVYVFYTILTSHSHQPRKRALRYTNNLRAFHCKHVLLSHVMLFLWFISTYLRHCTVIGTMEFLNPTRDWTSRLSDLLGVRTFPKYPHRNNTTFSYHGTSYLDKLRAYAAQPSKSTRTLHLDLDSFDICVDSGALAMCTMTKDDFVPGTF